MRLTSALECLIYCLHVQLEQVSGDLFDINFDESLTPEFRSGDLAYICNLFSIARLAIERYFFNYSLVPNRRYAQISVTPDKIPEINKRYEIEFTQINVVDNIFIDYNTREKDFFLLLT